MTKLSALTAATSVSSVDLVQVTQSGTSKQAAISLLVDLLSDTFQTATDGDATPSITSGNLIRTANTSPITITNFDDGAEGDLIVVFVEDANTTIANNATISLHGAANRAASTGGYVVRLRHNGTQWVEEGIGSVFDRTVSVNVDGSDNLTISNAATDADLVIDTTGTSSTAAVAVNGTQRVIVDNTGVDLVGTIKNNGAALIVDDDTFATASATTVPSSESVAAFVTANAGGSSVAPKTLAHPSMYLWSLAANQTVTGGTGSNNAMYLVPMHIDRDITVDEIKFEVTSGFAANAKVVIYDSDGIGGYPSSLLYDGSDIDCTATGIKTETLGTPLVVNAGSVIWVGLWQAANGISVRRANGLRTDLGSTGSSLTTISACLFYTGTTYGTAPDPITLTPTNLSANGPAVLLLGIQ